MKLDHSILTVTVSQIRIQRNLSSSLLTKTGLLFSYKIFIDIKNYVVELKNGHGHILLLYAHFI